MRKHQETKKEVGKIFGFESTTFGQPLDQVLSSLLEVYKQCSCADWDGYGAVAVTPDAYEEARTIIDLLPSSIQVPEIVAEPTGEIGFEWRQGRGRIFIMSVNGRHRISYASIFDGNKTHGSEYFEKTLPSVVIEHVRRLYS